LEPITIYTTHWCGDCRRGKYFLSRRGVEYREINIEEDPSAESVVLNANAGKLKVPTLKVGERYLPAARSVQCNWLLNSRFL
jgi:mycoredoxin